MNKISIGYFADGPWSHNAFELINNDGSIITKFIIARKGTTDLTLKGFAENNNIDYYSDVNINSKEFIDIAKKYNCDLFVSMSFNQIFKKEIINLPKLKSINCHAGKLPFYRGRNILNWVLINDEKEFGITVHYIDEGIDTGDIILQRTFPISDLDDYSSLLKVAYHECSLILYDTIKIIQNGLVKRITQIEIDKYGFYCGQRGKGYELINWNQTSREIFNFIRAICKPGPMAQTYCRGEVLYINKARYIKDTPKYLSTIGQVVGKKDNIFYVKTKDSIIEVIEYEFPLKVRVGDRLNNIK